MLSLPLFMTEEFLSVVYDYCPPTLYELSFSLPQGLNEILIKTMIKVKHVSKITFYSPNCLFDSDQIEACLDKLANEEERPSQLKILRIICASSAQWNSLLPKALKTHRSKLFPLLTKAVFVLDSTVNVFEVFHFQDDQESSVPKLLNVKTVDYD